MRQVFKWLVYVSLLFVIVHLARRGLLDLPRVASVPHLLASAAFLVAGFLGASEAWRSLLVAIGLASGRFECLASMGLSIFAKYIPGKLWVILGRAAYLAERRRLSLGALSTASLNDQLVGLWAGLLLGTIGLLLVGGLHAYGLMTLVAWIGLTLLVFSPWAHRIAEQILTRIFRRSIDIPSLPLRVVLHVLPRHLIYWTLWSIGFHLLVIALGSESGGAPVGLAFSLAGSLGILAVIAPGGLGVREGIMTGFLSLAGVPVTEATAIAIGSRLWFLSGEVIFFLLGFAAHRRLADPPGGEFSNAGELERDRWAS